MAAPLPQDINDRVRNALKQGHSPEAIQADIKQKYGVDASVHPLSGLDRAGNFANSFLSKLAGFTGTDKAGESLGRLGEQLSQVGNKAAGVKQSTFNVPQVSGKQLTGDVLTLAGTGLNLAAPGGGSLGKTVAANAGAAGLLGTGNDLTQGKGVGEALQHGGTKAAVAGAVTGGVGLLGKLIGSLTTKAPAAIYKTSTRIPNQTDADLLLEQGITGNREQLAQKAAEAMKTSEAAIQGSPRLNDAVDFSKVLDDPNLTRIGKQSQSVGKGEAFGKVVGDVLPQARVSLPALQAQVEDLAAEASKTNDPQALQAFHDAFKQLQDLQSRPGATRGGALAIRRAIDANTPNSAFADTSTAIEAKTKNAIADALRRTISQGAPDIAEPLKNEQAITQLQGALGAYERGKASPVPYNVGNILQRTILTPAVGTRTAKAGYEVGKGLTGLQQNLIVEALKRAGRVGSIAGLGKF